MDISNRIPHANRDVFCREALDQPIASIADELPSGSSEKLAPLRGWRLMDRHMSAKGGWTNAPGCAAVDQGLHQRPVRCILTYLLNVLVLLHSILK